MRWGLRNAVAGLSFLVAGCASGLGQYIGSQETATHQVIRQCTETDLYYRMVFHTDSIEQVPQSATSVDKEPLRVSSARADTILNAFRSGLHTGEEFFAEYFSLTPRGHILTTSTEQFLEAARGRDVPEDHRRRADNSFLYSVRQGDARAGYVRSASGADVFYLNLNANHVDPYASGLHESVHRAIQDLPRSSLTGIAAGMRDEGLAVALSGFLAAADKAGGNASDKQVLALVRDKHEFIYAGATRAYELHDDAVVPRSYVTHIAGPLIALDAMDTYGVVAGTRSVLLAELPADLAERCDWRTVAGAAVDEAYAGLQRSSR